MVSQENTVIIVAGPTAVGKTSVAIQLAKYFDTEIISADSRQCYKELDIGVGRPSAEELAEIQHHFIASHSIHDKQTAASFEQFALAKTAELFQKKKVVVLAGGTGLYIKAFCEGLDEIPTIPEALRSSISQAYQEHGLSWLQEQVKTFDPRFYESGETLNPQRLMRALEVVNSTGQSILDFRNIGRKERDFHMIGIALELPKPLLHQNINHRVDVMMERGWLDEVQTLVPYQDLNALQTVGYKELFAYLNTNPSLEETIEQIKLNTRKYAKRQLTWFKKDKQFAWFHPQDIAAIIEHLSGRGVTPAF
ncbi:MAG TPA: tRNA (adenosine(37)-N6)-dimethylallyltransferase MiaA [Chitinophagaceae bacterium]|nr:tRNA (adenosine(37)-N6)-dimethylallyltransferase MiaA [Chitinophagaceae bacterium]